MRWRLTLVAAWFEVEDALGAAVADVLELRGRVGPRVDVTWSDSGGAALLHVAMAVVLVALVAACARWPGRGPAVFAGVGGVVTLAWLAVPWAHAWVGEGAVRTELFWLPSAGPSRLLGAALILALGALAAAVVTGWLPATTVTPVVAVAMAIVAVPLVGDVDVAAAERAVDGEAPWDAERVNLNAMLGGAAAVLFDVAVLRAWRARRRAGRVGPGAAPALKRT